MYLNHRIRLMFSALDKLEELVKSAERPLHQCRRLRLMFMDCVYKHDLDANLWNEGKLRMPDEPNLVDLEVRCYFAGLQIGLEASEYLSEEEKLALLEAVRKKYDYARDKELVKRGIDRIKDGIF